MLELLLIAIPIVILFLTLISRLIEGEEELDLDSDEEVLTRAYRHWAVIFLRCALIGSAALLFWAIAFYRSIGGTFISSEGGPGSQTGIDIFNLVLLVIVGILLFMRIRLGRRAVREKKRMPRWERWLFLIVLGILAFLFAFRYDGGRVFNIEAANAVGLDTLNALLIGVGILLFALVIYTYFDLRDDSLVVTTFRVMRREVQEVPIFGAFLSFFLGRKIVIREYLQQMVIEDIQQVSVRQENYFEFYLYQFFRLLERFGVRGYQRYGNIVVQSLSFQVLKFEDACAPLDVQKIILARKAEITKNDTPELLLRRNLEAQVWGTTPPPQRRFHHLPTQQSAGLFSWLFPPNPEYKDDKSRTIIWRPSYLFILWRMLRAVLALAAVIIGALLLNAYNVLDGSLLTAIAVPLAVASLIWAWWIYDTYQHDLYILTAERIIDEDKAPFGPRNRREAELRSIQNVFFEETFFEGLLNFGRVVIRTGGAGGGDFTFSHVPNPREVQAQINAYIVDYRRRDQAKNNQQVVQAISQYHVLQESREELLKPELVDRIVAQRLHELAANISTAQDDEVVQQILSASRQEARWSARSELYALIRRFLRRQNRGRT